MSRRAELLERFGTPLYVYDLDRVDAAHDDLRAALPEPVALHYAVKANPHPDVIRALRGGDRPCRAEVSSTGELAVALAAGVPPSHCLYTGPGKTTRELDDAIRLGVRLFSAESPGDLGRIGAAAVDRGVEVDCLLRVNGATPGGATGLRMTGAPSQFGTDADALPALLPDLARAPGARLVGAHFFPLSCARDEAALLAEFANTAASAAALRDAGLPLRVLDIGGGFAAPYATPGERPRYPGLKAGLATALDRHLPGWRRGEPAVIAESGRYLVGDCGELLCGVVDVKHSRGRRFVVLDAGVNTFGGLSGLGRLLPVSVVLDQADGPTAPATLAGPLCTPGDVLGRQVLVPDLAPGDTVTIPNAGAYGPTASLLAFLGRPAPTEVVLRAGRVVSASRLEHRRTDLAPPALGTPTVIKDEFTPRSTTTTRS